MQLFCYFGVCVVVQTTVRVLHQPTVVFMPIATESLAYKKVTHNMDEVLYTGIVRHHSANGSTY